MRKLKTKRQMLLYAISGMGVNMLNLMMGSYLCSALIASGFGKDVIAYQTFAQKDLVIAAVWAVFGLVAKIIDGIIDVPMASLTDNLKSRWGRRRPSLMIGFIPMVAAYLLFLVVPNDGATLWNTIYYGVVLCIFYSFYTLTMVTYYATFTEIVDSERDRSFISNVKSVCDIIYFILGYVGVRAMLNGMNIRTVALIVLPLSLTMMIPMFMIHEPSTLDGVGEKTESVSIIKSLRCTFRNKAFILWMIVYAFMTFGVQLFLSGINEYFSKAGMSMIYVMIASFLPVPLTLMLFNKIQRKWGFGVSFTYVLLTFSVGMLSMFAASYLPAGTAKTVISILCGLICSFAVGALFAVAYSIPSELAAQEEKKTGIANSAMYFAVQGLFSGVATGIGASVVLTTLKDTDTVFYLTAISALGTLVAAVLMPKLPKSLKLLGKEKSEK